MCDASDIAVLADLHQKNGEDLLPIVYSSHLLTPVKRKYSAYEKECLAVVYGCEKHRSYLEHKEFALFTDNEALFWPLRHAKELDRIERWVLHLAPFKFQVSHISGKTYVVADCLTRQYDEPPEEVTFSGLVSGNLPKAFQSISEHQKQDPFCRTLFRQIIEGDKAAKNFKLLNGAVIHHPSRPRAKRYLLPGSLQPMLLEYFHSSQLSAHLGTTKTLNKISKVYYWPGMRTEVLTFVRQCQDCQQAKPAKDSLVRLWSWFS
jgi:hypothetical protein